MNKSVRFLIVFIIVFAMFALTWRQDSRGALVGDALSSFGSAVPTPSPVAENTEAVENNTARMHNLVLVEFFAGY